MSIAVPVTCFSVATDPLDLSGHGPGIEGTGSCAAAAYGGEVSVDGASEYLTGFTFEYFANYDRPSGLVFRFYRQDAAGGIPCEDPERLVYEQWMDVRRGGARVTACFSETDAAGFPSRMHYSVSFLGLRPGEVAGLIGRGLDLDSKNGEGAGGSPLDAITPDESAILCQWRVFATAEPWRVGLMVTSAGLWFGGFRDRC